MAVPLRTNAAGHEQPKPHKKRRERDDDGIYWDKINKCWVGTICLGLDAQGKRIRRRARAKTKAELKAKLDELHDEIKAGIRTSATYTIKERVADCSTSSPWTRAP